MIVVTVVDIGLELNGLAFPVIMYDVLIVRLPDCGW